MNIKDQEATTAMCESHVTRFQLDPKTGKSVFKSSSFQPMQVGVESGKRLGGGGNVPIDFERLSPELQDRWGTAYAELVRATWEEVKAEYPNDTTEPETPEA